MHSLLKREIEETLSNSGRKGFLQSDFHLKKGFSKSRVSEILSEMARSRQIEIRKDAGRSNRVWLSRYFPGNVPGTVRAGMLASSEYVYHMAALREYCANSGNRLDVRLYSKSADIVDDLLSDTLDLGFSPLISFLIHPENSRLRILSEVASGGSSIFENPGSANRRIISSEFSSMAILTKAFEKYAGPLEAEALLTPIGAVSDFLDGESRFIAIWEPFAEIIRQGGFREAFRFSDALDNLPCCCIGAGSSWIESRVLEVSKLLEVIRKFVSKKNDEQVIKNEVGYFADLLKVNEGTVLESLHHYTFLSGKDERSISAILEKIGFSVSRDTVNKMLSIH